jgi:hypothetical protein
MQLLVTVSLLWLTVACFAAEKEYQTGKLMDVDSQAYSKIVRNTSTGSAMSVRRHENDLSVQVGDVVYVGHCEESRHSSCKPGN